MGVRKSIDYMNVLRKLVLFSLLFALVKEGFCQERYYVYIQSQNSQSFYVRIGSSIFHASGNGYLLIPGLEKNNYQLIIGFSEENSTEWSFNCAVDDADVGFILKGSSKEGVRLVQLDQQSELKGTPLTQQPEKKSASVSLTGNVSQDVFSTMLAGVVNDPTIRQQLVILDKKEITSPTIIKDSISSFAAITPEASLPTKESIAEKDTPEISERIKSVTVTTVPEVKESVAIIPDVASRAGKESDVNNKQDAIAAVQSGISSKDPEIKPDEPFIIKEVILKPQQDQEGIKPIVAKKDPDTEDEVKFLPFEIKPADKPEQKEAGIAKANTIKKKETGKSNQVSPADESSSMAQKNQPAPVEKKALLSVVKKTLERKSREGVDLVYIDEGTNGLKDTIRILIPSVN